MVSKERNEIREDMERIKKCNKKRERVMKKKCNKRCEYYVNGMCFKDPKRVKIIVKGDKCKWEMRGDKK